jgi:hypothetical protein
MSNPATGPRTDTGKERSSMNAVTHGLRAQTIVLASECEVEWQALRSAVVHEYRPYGLVETELVERIALQLWRLRRAATCEVEAFAAEDTDKALARVIRYEAHISRQLNQAIRLLRDLRIERENPIRWPVDPAPTAAEQSSFGTNGTPKPESSSFGKNGTAKPERDPMRARAAAFILRRLRELEDEDRRQRQEAPSILDPKTERPAT